MTDEVLETIRGMAWLQDEYGVDACRRYVISFTTSADDIANVYELAALATDGQPPVLDVVPLFETQDDLAAMRRRARRSVATAGRASEVGRERSAASK